MSLQLRLTGTLLGTAIGDALGLAVEGMSAKAIRKRFGVVDRFHLLGSTGYVSDDTEQSALIVQSLLRHPEDAVRCAHAFRHSLLGWFFRLPWGIGGATLRSCLRMAFGMSPSGVASAGNGAAMRAAVVGVFFHNDALQRHTYGTLLAETTHKDSRAVQGALFVAELAAACVRHDAQTDWRELIKAARAVVNEASLGSAIDAALALALLPIPVEEAGNRIGTTGFVSHTVPFAMFCFMRHGDDPARALTSAVNAGGDTDSIAAILGGWLGALHGEQGLPAIWIDRLCGGPFGKQHLRSLGSAASEMRQGKAHSIPTFSWPLALLRNLALYPVVLGHGLRHLFS